MSTEIGYNTSSIILCLFYKQVIMFLIGLFVQELKFIGLSLGLNNIKPNKQVTVSRNSLVATTLYELLSGYMMIYLIPLYTN